jgi:uncharacterized membrane protein
LFEFFFKYSLQDYARSEMVFTAQWPAWLLLLGATAAVAGLSAMLWRHRGGATVGQLLSVWTLQLAMLALVAVLLLQPALKTEQLKPGENTVALVVDNSASMAYGDGTSRFDIALESLAAAIPLDSAGLTAQHYAMSGSAQRVDMFAGTEATGISTSIADSLIDIIDSARSQSLAAVGIDTAGGISASQLADIAAFGVPVHTIGVGRDRIPEDLELAQLVAPTDALPGSTVTARVAIRHDREGEARVRVYDGDELLATQAVQLPGNATTTTTKVDIDLRDAGHHRLQFSVAGVDTEAELRNNIRSTLINVEEQQFRVLYFEGEPRWEYKFMRRAMDPDGDIRLVSLLRVSPNKFYRQGLESAQQLEAGFPSTRDELFAYDALIIGSVEAATLSNEQQQIIGDFVSERGGSLLMLAGPNGLGNGGWGQSAIADLLPAHLPPSAVNSFVRTKAAVQLTPQGADTEMLRLAATSEENAAFWASLPEVADYQAVGNMKPAALTLLNVVTETGAQPLLVTQPYGRGHVYILASGGTWRWQMSSPLEDLSHETFWQQFMRALAASAPQGISLSAKGSQGASEVQLRAEFRDDAFRPVEGVRVSAVVSHEDGDSYSLDLLPSLDDAAVHVASAPLSETGTWYVEAIAERDGEAIHVARTSVYSESEQAEHFNIRRDSAQLVRLSDATGGQYFEPANLGALPDLLRYSNAGITEQILRPVWDAPALFLLLFMVKFSEWLLRRRWRTI